MSITVALTYQRPYDARQSFNFLPTECAIKGLYDFKRLKGNVSSKFMSNC